jgi:hypothetical protein
MGLCPNAEYQPCDSTTRLSTFGVTATVAGGVKVRPLRWLEAGVHVRAPFTLATSGTVHADPPAAVKMPIADQPARFTISFPTIVRVGLRFVVMKGTHEAGDLEADATWENWAQAQGTGPEVHIDQLSIFQNIQTTVAHH